MAKKLFRPLPTEDLILATKLRLPVREMSRRRDLEEEASKFLNKGGFDKMGRKKHKPRKKR